MLRRVTGRLAQVRPFLTGEEALEDHWPPGLLALYTELEMWSAADRILTHLCAQIDDHSMGAQWGGVLAFMTEATVKLDDGTGGAAAAAVRGRVRRREPDGRTVRRRVRERRSPPGGAGLGPGRAERRSPLRAGTGRGPADGCGHRPGGDPRFLEPPSSPWCLGRSGPSSALRPDRRPPGWPTRRVPARRIGHQSVLRDLDAVPAPDVVHPPLPNGLTEREVDVLRLVAEGLLRTGRSVNDCSSARTRPPTTCAASWARPMPPTAPRPAHPSPPNTVCSGREDDPKPGRLHRCANEPFGVLCRTAP